ncbi:putative oxidoreductase [Byssothecium circinans]|uniref:Putative oxidoreductase n=1 Tax=Byssothecium circinans TaxID=147558 RepID=A0A6A5TRI2_9PLEO|nr:putative oxidoreductase [Byssothecium circinans]
MAFSSPLSVPEFPSEVPLLRVKTLSLSKILSNDADESRRMYEACTETGLFILDLSGSKEGYNLMEDVDRILSLSEQIFDLDLETKMKYHMLSGTVLGYKAAGTGRVDAKGTPDRCEFWCLSKNDILGLTPPLSAPELVNRHRNIYAPFIKRCHALSMRILERLEVALGVRVGALQEKHRIDHISSDQTRQIKYPPQPEEDRRTSLVPHTDYGSITVLFNVLGGLQVLPPSMSAEEKNWRWLKPVPNCAIINLGDAMVKFTNGLFKSPLHRVTYAPGAQAKMTRYSLAYFTRPEDECIMKRVDGSEFIPELGDREKEDNITAGEWIQTRVKAAQVQKEESKEEYPTWAVQSLK